MLLDIITQIIIECCCNSHIGKIYRVKSVKIKIMLFVFLKTKFLNYIQNSRIHFCQTKKWTGTCVCYPRYQKVTFNKKLYQWKKNYYYFNKVQLSISVSFVKLFTL